MSNPLLKSPGESTTLSQSTWIAAFLLINALLKFPLVFLNTGEYTDGILQLEVFTIKSGLYPPLYGALAWILRILSIDAELAGRLVSTLASVLTVIPIYLIARTIGGNPTARYAALLYTLSPLVLRWAPRVMTDSLYLLLSTTSLYYIATIWQVLLHRDGEQTTKSPKRLLITASIFAAAATLTRYQGILLTPLLAIPAFLFIRQYKMAQSWATLLLAALPWLALPIWMLAGGFVHGQQFSDRTAQSLLQTLLVYWSTFESFLLIAPYYFAYPVFALAIYGAIRGSRHTDRSIAWFHTPCLLYLLMLLALQSMFGSFQYRYLLPALPWFLVMAGTALAAMEQTLLGTPNLWKTIVFKLTLYGTILYLFIFSMAILVLQRQAFQDQKQAALWINENVPKETRVFSNERYGSFTSLGAVKLRFWTQNRPIHSIHDPFQPDGMATLRPGDLVVLGTYYTGSGNLMSVYQPLQQKYQLQPVAPTFHSTLIPLMDDIMTQGLYSQNPLGWVMRYAPQNFQTIIFRVQPDTTGSAI